MLGIGQHDLSGWDLNQARLEHLVYLRWHLYQGIHSPSIFQAQQVPSQAACQVHVVPTRSVCTVPF